MSNTTLTPSPLPAIAPEDPPPSRDTALAALDRAGLPLTVEGLTEMCAKRRSRNDGWTPMRLTVFLQMLESGASVTEAAASAGISTASCYRLRNHPDARPFREAWDAATMSRHEELTTLAIDRVRNGVERKRWWRDQIVGVDYLYSDRLLVQLLRQTDPARHDDSDARDARLRRPEPVGQDYVVAAAVDTGRLGWNPDDDDDYEDWPDDVLAAAAENRQRCEAEVADAEKKRAEVDARLKCTPERALRVARTAVESRVGREASDFDPADDGTRRLIERLEAEGVRASPTDRELAAADAQWEADYEDLTRPLTLSLSDDQPKKRSSSSRVSAGASSGRKCPPGTPRPRRSGA